MSFEGTIVNGNVLLDEPSSLPEGTRVDVEPKAEEPPFSFLLKFAGRAKGMPADAAAEHDHYIHGTPRRTPIDEPIIIEDQSAGQ